MNWPKTTERFGYAVIGTLAIGGCTKLAEVASQSINVRPEGIMGVAFIVALLGSYFLYGATRR